MFVKIERIPKDGRSQRRTSVYECASYHLDPVEGRSSEFTITVDRYGVSAICATYDTEGSGINIFVMNSQGRTIDTIFRSPD